MMVMMWMLRRRAMMMMIMIEEENRSQDREAHFRASLRSRNAHGHFTRAILCGNLHGKLPDPNPATHVLCEPAQSKRTWTFHKSHFVWKFTRKSAGRQSRDTAFCASLRSRNAHGHFTRAILCGNLQGKCRTPIPRHTCRFCVDLQGKCRTHLD